MCDAILPDINTFPCRVCGYAFAQHAPFTLPGAITGHKFKLPKSFGKCMVCQKSHKTHNIPIPNVWDVRWFKGVWVTSRGSIIKIEDMSVNYAMAAYWSLTRRLSKGMFVRGEIHDIDIDRDYLDPSMKHVEPLIKAKQEELLARINSRFNSSVGVFLARSIAPNTKPINMETLLTE